MSDLYDCPVVGCTQPRHIGKPTCLTHWRQVRPELQTAASQALRAWGRDPGNTSKLRAYEFEAIRAINSVSARPVTIDSVDLGHPGDLS